MLGTSPFAATSVPAITEEPEKESASMCESRAGVRLTLQRQSSIIRPLQQLGASSMGSMQLQGFGDGALELAPPLCRISVKLDGCLKVSAAMVDTPFKLRMNPMAKPAHAVSGKAAYCLFLNLCAHVLQTRTSGSQ